MGNWNSCEISIDMVPYYDSISSKEDCIIRLHTAIYLGKGKIYHSSVIEGKSDIWAFSKFIKYYKPIAAKRVL